MTGDLTSDKEKMARERRKRKQLERVRQVERAKQRLEVKNATLMWPVRIAAAGKLVTPGGAVEICRILGKDETLRRLNAGLAILGA